MVRRAAGQRLTVGEPGGTAAHVDSGRAEPEIPVSGTGGGDRIGDEHDAPGASGLEGDLGRRIVQVDPVVDELADDVGPRERGSHQPRLTVVPGPHGVEQVGDERRTGIEGGRRLVVRRVAVADRHHDAGGSRPTDELGATRQLGCHGDHAQRATGGVEHPLEGGGIRGQEVGGVVRAGPRRVQERSLEVAADDARDRVADGLERGQHLGQWRADDAGKTAGGAVRPMEGGGGRDLGRVCGERGVTTAPVHVEVDEARHHPSPTELVALVAAHGRCARADLDDAVAIDPEPSRIEHAGRRHDPAIAQQHHASSIRIRPLATGELSHRLRRIRTPVLSSDKEQVFGLDHVSWRTPMLTAPLSNADQAIAALLADPSLAPLITAHRELEPRPPRHAPWPDGLDPRLVEALRGRGIEALYTHQAAAYEAVHARKNVVVVTPTASGKTLCYNLPVIDAVAKDEAARALYLFPTKALAADQLVELRALAGAAEIGLKTHTYDGDTPANVRSVVRAAGHVVITNPDMLHAAILPHHTKWFKLFENLHYVVIDELHTYRGVFGSHVANVIRRLRRICNHYGTDPIFICASATIANPRELAERILEAPVELVDDNGAPRAASTSSLSTHRSPTRSSASAARRCSPGSAWRTA